MKKEMECYNKAITKISAMFGVSRPRLKRLVPFTRLHIDYNQENADYETKRQVLNMYRIRSRK